jgi:PAS domain S-box-containing protein
MPPPRPKAQPIAVSTASIPSPQPPIIAPQPGFGLTASLYETTASSFKSQLKDRKHQKRAANRRSAQLSRKRKKMFIEDLKEENDDLRRKEQILKSIPDLIVVFDSSGKLWFVSESVSRFLRFSSEELEGTSFWDRICQDSVRLLKAAFMDSLASRRRDSESAPLGSGIWELRLVDKDGDQKIVTLNGVVHFAGERPECVCSIRPRDERSESDTEDNEGMISSEIHQDRNGSSISFLRPSIRVNPMQSVVSSSSEDSCRKARKRGRKQGKSVRISDSNSSMESESGSEENEVAC